MKDEWLKGRLVVPGAHKREKMAGTASSSFLSEKVTVSVLY